MSLFGIKRKNKGVIDPKILEWERLKSLPFEESGYATDIFDKPFRFHHAASFVNTYREIFEDELYKFNPKIKANGIIIDCGANMGLSVLYFALNYPSHHIYAFEPEEKVFNILKENVENFQLQNVTLFQKAVWTEETELIFHSDGGMGGRLNFLYKDSELKASKVSTVDLKSMLNNNVDFLKIDIEGAEDEVLKDCQGTIGEVNFLFFEYHNDVFKPQTLHELLGLIVKAGFTYHLKESSARKKPFIDNSLICERYDMAITVFCYK